IVPSEDTGKKLIENGIDPQRVAEFGIPIDEKFNERRDKKSICQKLGLDENIPSVLVMGGTQGLGPISELIRMLDRSHINIQIIVATGTNKRLYKGLMRKSKLFRKKIVVLPYANNVDELMDISTIVITKPGGITTAEALAKGIPMLIINPLPGQEAMNTKFLLKEGVAVKAEAAEDVTVLLEELLYNRNKLDRMSERARALSKPNSAMNIAKLILESASK
ncbi:MAG: glycosyltransferase, partial [Candidatus Omnitrophota bacterium]